MKSMILTAMLAIGILILGSPLGAGQDHQFTMQVPFGFVAANHSFTAGDYTINFDIATGTVSIRNGHDGPTVSLLSYAAGDNTDMAHAKLVFNQYGNHFFLSQVCPAGSTARGLRKSREEVEIAKTARQPEVLTVIASVRRKASR